MIRRVVVGGAVVLLASACGGSRAPSVRDVERVFAEHGQAFQSEVEPNPYLRPAPDLWPARTRARVEPHLRAVLGAANSTTFSTLEVWVFDSAASARTAQQETPGMADRKGRVTGTGSSGFVVRQGNLIVTGSPKRWPAVRAALADLR